MRVVGIVFEGWLVFFCLAHCYPFLLSPWWDSLAQYTFGSPLGASFDEYILLLLIKKIHFLQRKIYFLTTKLSFEFDPNSILFLR